MKKLFIYQIIGLFLLLPFVSGCNDSDDLQEIFVGKTWRLTYINAKDKGGMMGGFDEKSIKIFNENNEAYTIVFTGTEEDNKITGNISGQVITSKLSGGWSANGKDNQFKANPQNVNETDGLAKEFMKGLTTASSYEGDSKNLFLYYTPSGSQQTFVLAFHVKK